MLLRTITTVAAHQQLGCDTGEAQPSPFPSQMCHLTPRPIPLQDKDPAKLETTAR